MGSLCVCMRKTVAKSFNRENLQQMTELTQIITFMEKYLWGLSVPASELYTCISPIFSNISETAWPINAKFHAEHLLEGGRKLNINGPGHMTKISGERLQDHWHSGSIYWIMAFSWFYVLEEIGELYMNGPPSNILKCITPDRTWGLSKKKNSK